MRVVNPPKEVVLWDNVFADVNNFADGLYLEECVCAVFQVNICQVLNKLMVPDYNFSICSDEKPGIPDPSCHHVQKIIFPIENKRRIFF